MSEHFHIVSQLYSALGYLLHFDYIGPQGGLASLGLQIIYQVVQHRHRYRVAWQGSFERESSHNHAALTVAELERVYDGVVEPASNRPRQKIALYCRVLKGKPTIEARGIR